MILRSITQHVKDQNWLDPMKDRRGPRTALQQVEFLNIVF